DALLPIYEALEAGDVLIGLGSSGIHSNGFSLIRRLIDDLGLNLDAPAPFDASQSLRQALLAPTRLYGAAVHAALDAVPGAIRALCHVTGGGLPGNLHRVLREDLQAEVDPATWSPVPLFGWLQSLDRVELPELYRTFNMGLGMVLVVRAGDAGDVMAALAGQAPVFRVGEVRSRPSTEVPQVHISGVSG
ncbi:MAG: AIR synthase-related protein, partial [Pseudomonadota bacterium]|nr:AIR synthase-related protein [Pseudomonadota bacterium]